MENASSQAHRLYHLGSVKLSRSNLSRMNNEKPSALYEALFGKLLVRCQRTVPGHNFRFKNALYSWDASTIDLCLSVFPWADFRATKGAVKLLRIPAKMTDHSGERDRFAHRYRAGAVLLN